MIRKQTNSSGFGAATLLLGIVLLAVAAGVAYVAYSRIANKSERTPASQAKSTTSSDNKIKSKTVYAEPNRLDIKEWGITIPLPESLSDAYYVPSIASADPDGSVNSIWLGLKSKDSPTCAARLGNTGGSTLGALVRTLPSDTDPITGKSYPELYTGVVIEKYFYGFGASVNADNKCDSVASRSEINTAFGQAAKDSYLTSVDRQ